MTSEFSFLSCQIYVLEFSISDKTIHLEELKSFVKDNPTIICRSSKPTKLHIDLHNSDHFLLDSDHIKGIWCQKAMNTINLLTNPTCKIYIFYFTYPVVTFFSLGNKY